MTLSLGDVAFYCASLFILFLTPGPVWLAIFARSLSHGFRSAFSFALGVAIGDILWPVAAALGMGWIVTSIDGAMTALRLLTTIFFLYMGISLIRHAKKSVIDAQNPADKKIKTGMTAGFVAGFLVIMTNPKAVLFYMGILPGFFDLIALTLVDIVVIATASCLVPLIGNAALALLITRIKRHLTSPKTLTRLNQISGAILCAVGVLILLT